MFYFSFTFICLSWHNGKQLSAYNWLLSLRASEMEGEREKEEDSWKEHLLRLYFFPKNCGHRLVSLVASFTYLPSVPFFPSTPTAFIQWLTRFFSSFRTHNHVYYAPSICNNLTEPMLLFCTWAFVPYNYLFKVTENLKAQAGQENNIYTKE